MLLQMTSRGENWRNNLSKQKKEEKKIVKRKLEKSFFSKGELEKDAARLAVNSLLPPSFVSPVACTITELRSQLRS